MAKPKKGVIPPHLRKFLFKKGQKPPSKKGARPISSKRGSSPPPGRAGGRMASTKQHLSGVNKWIEENLGARVRPVQMGISAGFGLIADKFLDRLGAAQAVKAAFPQSQPFFDYMYQHAPAGWRNDSLSDGGNKGIATLLGGGAGLKVLADGFTKGKFDSKDINFLAPFSIGQYFDSPEGAPGAPMGLGAGFGKTPSRMAGSSESYGGAGWV